MSITPTSTHTERFFDYIEENCQITAEDSQIVSKFKSIALITAGTIHFLSETASTLHFLTDLVDKAFKSFIKIMKDCGQCLKGKAVTARHCLGNKVWALYYKITGKTPPSKPVENPETTEPKTSDNKEAPIPKEKSETST